MNAHSYLWVITVTLFLGGAGLPIPENPFLIGGGYAIYKHACPSIASLCLWFSAITAGDILLFGISRWVFTRPTLLMLLRKRVSKKRHETYQEAFANRGGWTLFLVRFTFGLRAVAYLAAGAARYPWRDFLAWDSLSVAIQVLLFVGIGYNAGDRIEAAMFTGERIALILAFVTLAGILITYAFSLLVKKLSS